MITLELDNGTSIECEIMGTFDVDGIEYIALANAEGGDDIYLYQYVEINEEEFELKEIPEEDFDKVVEEFDNVMDSLGE